MRNPVPAPSNSRDNFQQNQNVQIPNFVYAERQDSLIQTNRSQSQLHNSQIQQQYLDKNSKNEVVSRRIQPAQQHNKTGEIKHTAGFGGTTSPVCLGIMQEEETQPVQAIQEQEDFTINNIGLDETLINQSYRLEQGANTLKSSATDTPTLFAQTNVQSHQNKSTFYKQNIFSNVVSQSQEGSSSEAGSSSKDLDQRFNEIINKRQKEERNKAIKKTQIQTRDSDFRRDVNIYNQIYEKDSDTERQTSTNRTDCVLTFGPNHTETTPLRLLGARKVKDQSQQKFSSHDFYSQQNHSKREVDEVRIELEEANVCDISDLGQESRTNTRSQQLKIRPQPEKRDSVSQKFGNYVLKDEIFASKHYLEESNQNSSQSYQKNEAEPAWNQQHQEYTGGVRISFNQNMQNRQSAQHHRSSYNLFNLRNSDYGRVTNNGSQQQNVCSLNDLLSNRHSSLRQSTPSFNTHKTLLQSVPQNHDGPYVPRLSAKRTSIKVKLHNQLQTPKEIDSVRDLLKALNFNSEDQVITTQGNNRYKISTEFLTKLQALDAQRDQELRSPISLNFTPKQDTMHQARGVEPSSKSNELKAQNVQPEIDSNNVQLRVKQDTQLVAIEQADNASPLDKNEDFSKAQEKLVLASQTNRESNDEGEQGRRRSTVHQNQKVTSSSWFQVPNQIIDQEISKQEMVKFKTTSEVIESKNTPFSMDLKPLPKFSIKKVLKQSNVSSVTKDKQGPPIQSNDRGEEKKEESPQRLYMSKDHKSPVLPKQESILTTPSSPIPTSIPKIGKKRKNAFAKKTKKSPEKNKCEQKPVEPGDNSDQPASVAVQSKSTGNNIEIIVSNIGEDSADNSKMSFVKATQSKSCVGALDDQTTSMENQRSQSLNPLENNQVKPCDTPNKKVQKKVPKIITTGAPGMNECLLSPQIINQYQRQKTVATLVDDHSVSRLTDSVDNFMHKTMPKDSKFFFNRSHTKLSFGAKSQISRKQNAEDEQEFAFRKLTRDKVKKQLLIMMQENQKQQKLLNQQKIQEQEFLNNCSPNKYLETSFVTQSGSPRDLKSSKMEQSSKHQKEIANQKTKGGGKDTTSSKEDLKRITFKSSLIRDESVTISFDQQMTANFQNSSNQNQQNKNSDKQKSKIKQYINFCAINLGLDPAIFLTNEIQQALQQSEQQRNNSSGERSDLSSSDDQSDTSNIRGLQTQKTIKKLSKSNPQLKLPEVAAVAKVFIEQISQATSNKLKESLSNNIMIPKPQDSLAVINQSSMENLSFKQPPTTNLSSQTLNREATMISNVTQDIVKLKIQINILNYYIRHVVRDVNVQNISHLCNLFQILILHEEQVEKIMQRIKTEDQKLHFAFLFASPLVLSGQYKDESAYRLLEPLNYQKEFSKIRDSVTQAQVQITMTKRQCTLSSLSEVLAQNPMGIHFSGHGLLNKAEEIGPELADHYEGKGDLLLLETETGDSQLVSRDQLRQMINKTHANIEFVVVATCHSEFVGRIFQEAGVKHVICIQQSEEVEDDAVITFTDTFYGLLFEQEIKICNAFEQAQFQVRLAHSDAQAEIFKLLLASEVRDNQGLNIQQNKQKNSIIHSDCQVFGPFQKGRFKLIDPVDVPLKYNYPIKTKLRGRQKDIFMITHKVLSNKEGRLFTIKGIPGVGKSALVQQMLQFISERGLLRGGQILFNARSIDSCSTFMSAFNVQMISENQLMFGNAKQQREQKKDQLQTLKLILTKLNRLEGQILLVIDNCEDLIEKERINFKMLISTLLQRVPQLQIILTSRIPLTSTAEFKEISYELQPLSKKQSMILFKSMTRDIYNDEIQRLLDLDIDEIRYPDEALKPKPKNLYDHHLFTLLNGNPQAIIIVAPILMDSERCLDLGDLYQLLSKSDIIQTANKNGQYEDAMLESLRISASVSINHIKEKDHESMNLFFLLGCLPAGVQYNELDILWKKLKHEIQQPQQTDVNSPFAQKDALSASSLGFDQIENLRNQSEWSRSLDQLKKGNLIDEVLVNQEQSKKEYAKKTADQKDQEELMIGTTSSEVPKNKHYLVQMPKFIRTFALQQMSEEVQNVITRALAAWYNQQLHKLYTLKANKYSSQSQLYDNESFLRFSSNLIAFIESLKEDYSDFNIYGEDMSEHQNNQIENKFDRTDEESDELEWEAERMFGRQKEGENEKSISMTISSIEDITPKTQNQVHDFNSFSQNNPSLKRLKTQVQANGKLNIKSKWMEEIQETYAATKAAYSVFEDKRNKVLDQIRKQSIRRQSIFQLQDPDQRAVFLWKFAYDKIREKEKNALNRARMKISLGERDIEEGDKNNGFVESAESNSSEESGDGFRSMLENKIGNQRPRQISHFTSVKNVIPNKTRVSSYRLYRKDKTQNSSYHRSSTVFQKTMYDEESALVYYLADLMLYGMHREAEVLCMDHYIYMNTASNLFKGNVRRLQALNLFMHLKQKFKFSQDNKHDITSKIRTEEYQLFCDQIENYLKRAMYNFKEEKCSWGLGLTFLQQAVFEIFKLEVSQQDPTMNAVCETTLPINRQSFGTTDFMRISTNSMANNQNINSNFQGISQQLQSSSIVPSNQRKNELVMPSARSFQHSFIEKARESLYKAIEYLKEINHLRGLKQVYRMLYEIQINIKKWKLPESRDSFRINRDLKENATKYSDMYGIAIDNDQRKCQNRDLCIQRIQGEEFSILIEVIHSSKVSSFFDMQHIMKAYEKKIKIKKKISESLSELIERERDQNSNIEPQFQEFQQQELYVASDTFGPKSPSKKKRSGILMTSQNKEVLKLKSQRISSGRVLPFIRSSTTDLIQEHPNEDQESAAGTPKLTQNIFY